MTKRTGARFLRSSLKHWPPSSVSKLRAMYPKYSKGELMKAFPSRSWEAIKHKGRSLGLRRARKYNAVHATPTKDDLMTDLRHLRHQRNLSAYKLGKMIGRSGPIVARCESGSQSPSIATLTRWCAALGHELTLRPIRASTIPVFRLNGEHKEAGE